MYLSNLVNDHVPFNYLTKKKLIIITDDKSRTFWLLDLAFGLEYLLNFFSISRDPENS